MSKDLRAFLDDLQERLPYDFVRIERPVSPKQFEVTALLQHLENQKKFQSYSLRSRSISTASIRIPVLTMSSQPVSVARCLSHETQRRNLPLSLEYARREDMLLAPVTIPRSEAPVKQVIKRGDEQTFMIFPSSAITPWILRHTST